MTRVNCVDAKIAWAISILKSGYTGDVQKAECIALLMEARAGIERILPLIKHAEVRETLMGPGQ